MEDQIKQHLKHLDKEVINLADATGACISDKSASQHLMLSGVMTGILGIQAAIAHLAYIVAHKEV